ncbi:hypothetical protein [Streptomyces sp. NBC_00932]|uniref:hypothetical protein n=1 Tax=Streptomyces sp. NBC_00932 TaxID=2903690 RepID=UPI003864B0E9|nr:hypothetical protein OG221_00130 [Streptomyces sp. NBC_00932]
MTDEVGVITGDLTVHTARLASVTLQYTGAEEWYTLTGSPATVPDKGLDSFHAVVLAAVALGGEATVRNRTSTTLAVSHCKEGHRSVRRPSPYGLRSSCCGQS